MKLESKNIKSAIDPYKANDSREEEEENDEANSLEGDEAMPPQNSTPRRTGLAPKGAPMDAQDHRERLEMLPKSSCSKLIGYTLGRGTSMGAAQANL